MSTPDITPAQIKAVLIAVLGLAAAFGIPLSPAKQEAIFKVVEILPVALVLADAVIRHGRAVMHGKVEMAKTILPEND